MSFRDRTKSALKDLLESQGEDAAADMIGDMLESKEVRPEDFSIREIWEATNPGVNLQEAVASSAFPKITGELINSKVMSAYDGVAKIGDQLVTTVSSNVQQETIAGFTEAETPEEVGEGQEYNDSTFTEKFVTIRNKKFGRMISVTEEMIYFDKTGQILARANRIGTKAAQYREMLILNGIQDINSNVYAPSGVPTAFYSAANGNLATVNAFDEAGMQTVTRLAHLQKDDSLGDEADDYIMIDENNAIVIVPKELELAAWQLANSVLTPESAEQATNFYKGRFRILTSPYVTAQNATTWYWGDFKQDFWWTEVWPLQTMAQAAGADNAFTKDIKMRAKVRFFGNIGALDVRHSYKSTA